MLLLLLFVVGVIAAALIARRRRGHRVTEPVCGQCGYRVQGLPTFTCPECGADLREVGIVTPRQTRPLGFAALAVAWTLLLPVPAVIISVALAATVLPKEERTTQTVALGSPASQAYTSLDLFVEGSRLVWLWQTRGEPPWQRVELNLISAPGAPSALDVDVGSMGYSYQKADGVAVTAPSGLDAQVLGDWLTTAGVDTADPAVRSEIQKVLGLIQGARTRNMQPILRTFAGQGQVSGGRSVFIVVWAGLALAGFWVLVWVAGLWYCYRRTRRAS